MNDLSKYRPVVLEEGFYTISDAIKEIAKVFDLSFSGKNGEVRRKTLYQHLRRELQSMNLSKKYVKNANKRGAKYSHMIWNTLLNHGLYSWLCNFSGKAKYAEFQEWKERRKNYERRYAKIIESAEQTDELFQTPSAGIEFAVDKEFQRRRLSIALDYIFSECIELDEKLLRTDLEIDLAFDEACPSDYDLMVNERLMSDRNYYKVKEKKRSTIFKDTSNK